MNSLYRLQSDLAALQMKWALVKLMYKYSPNQPRTPAGCHEGGRWCRPGAQATANGSGLRSVIQDANAQSKDKTLGMSFSDRDKARRAFVLQDGGGDFYVAPNPSANPDAPWYADPSKSTVGIYNDGIIYAANKEGVDPDLIRSIMYVETTQGYYLGLGTIMDKVGLSKTILPMNIYASLWSALGSRNELNDPLYNIIAGAKILKGIQANLAEPDIVTVATLYNALAATKVSDYGARVAAVYKDKPWLH